MWAPASPASTSLAGWPITTASSHSQSTISRSGFIRIGSPWPMAMLPGFMNR